MAGRGHQKIHARLPYRRRASASIVFKFARPPPSILQSRGDAAMASFVCLNEPCGRMFENADRYPSCPHCGCARVTTTRVPPPTQLRPNVSDRTDSAGTGGTDKLKDDLANQLRSAEERSRILAARQGINGIYAKGLASCISTISLAQPTDRLAVFQNMAREAASYVHKGGINVSEFADRFQNVAVAYGLVEAHGQDAIQAILADALKEQSALNEDVTDSHHRPARAESKKRRSNNGRGGTFSYDARDDGQSATDIDLNIRRSRQARI